MEVSSVAPKAVQSVALQAHDVGQRISVLSVGSWALYDFANTIFSLNIISNYFPQYIVADHALRDAVYAYPQAFALLLVALVMPLLGALSDRAGRRMPWLVGFTLLCIAMTAVMGLVDNVWLVIAAFVIANIGYQTALVFYDALLPAVSTTLNWGKISGFGVGLGYVGALFGGLVVTLLLGDTYKNQDAFLPTAILFLIFALPCFFLVREHHKGQVYGSQDASIRRELQPLSWRNAFTQIWHTLEDAREVPGLMRFLVANFFYSDALNTVIIAMGVYATQVIGFKSVFSVLAPATIAAVIGSWIFGIVTDRLTAKRALIISLSLWIPVLLAAIFITDQTIFQWGIATLAGVALGSTWTSARTMMVELSPPHKLGEFMGIYNLTGKFSAVLGPALWGTTLLVLNPEVVGKHLAYGIAIGTLLLMVILGLVIHLGTPNIRRVKG
ncbi:MAG: MFS transporter [Chloroflexota bacterium]